MRVTIVSRIFSPEPAAASQRLEALRRGLVAGGASVTVCTTKPPQHLRTPADRRDRAVRRWPVLRDRSGYVRGYLQYLSFDIPAFFRVLFGARPDVVVVEPPPTTGFAMRVACALRRTPYVYYAADIWSQAAASTGAGGLVLRAVRWMERAALHGAASCLAVTEGVAQAVHELAPRANVDVVGHGVDTDVFIGADGPQVSAYDVVYVGTASEWHGAGVFIEALALAQQGGASVSALFVGQGSDWQDLQDRAAQLGVRDIRFRPPVPPPQAAQILCSARVALASLKPGIGYDYAVPTKSYSALAVGTPVLYSGPDPVRSLIEREDLGWGVDADPARVAEALLAATAEEPSRARRARIAAWARESVSAEAVARRAGAVIAAVAARSGR